jgi:hypothetical protein
MQMFRRTQDDERFLDSVLFSDEGTFRVNGEVSTHNCRVWGNENSRASKEHVPDSRKMNVSCGLCEERVHGPFFTETTITGNVYLDMLQHLVPQLDEDDQDGRIHFQQDGAPPPCLGEMREYLNTRFPGRWIGRAAPIACSPRSSDLTSLDLFLGGFVHRNYPR